MTAVQAPKERVLQSSAHGSCPVRPAFWPTWSWSTKETSLCPCGQKFLRKKQNDSWKQKSLMSVPTGLSARVSSFGDRSSYHDLKFIFQSCKPGFNFYPECLVTWWKLKGYYDLFLIGLLLSQLAPKTSQPFLLQWICTVDIDVDNIWHILWLLLFLLMSFLLL